MGGLPLGSRPAFRLGFVLFVLEEAEIAQEIPTVHEQRAELPVVMGEEEETEVHESDTSVVFCASFCLLPLSTGTANVPTSECPKTVNEPHPKQAKHKGRNQTQKVRACNIRATSNTLLFSQHAFIERLEMFLPCWKRISRSPRPAPRYSHFYFGAPRSIFATDGRGNAKS